MAKEATPLAVNPGAYPEKTIPRDSSISSRFPQDATLTRNYKTPDPAEDR